LVAKDSIKSNDIDPLTPAKAAFYSAVLPGLGQAYNKKYWKINCICHWTSLYFYIDSNKKYNQYRDAYKRRLEGYSDDSLDYLDTEINSWSKVLKKQRLICFVCGCFLCIKYY
jgi:hypothetical protein